MRDPEEETTRRSNQASGTMSTGLDIAPYPIEQVAELIKTGGPSWLETLGEWVYSALLRLGDD